MKKILLVLLIVFWASISFGADTGIVSMTEDTTSATSDLLYEVKDPGGTPLDRKVTLQNAVKGGLGGNSAGLAAVLSDETGTGLVVFGTNPSITPQVIDCSAACSPTAAQLSNARVENYGQTTADVAITGPTLASGMNFIMIVGTAQAGNYWRYTSTAANVYLDAAGPYTNVGFAAPAVGNSLACFSFRTGASAWSMRCTTLAGTSNGS